MHLFCLTQALLKDVGWGNMQGKKSLNQQTNIIIVNMASEMGGMLVTVQMRGLGIFFGITLCQLCQVNSGGWELRMFVCLFFNCSVAQIYFFSPEPHQHWAVPGVVWNDSSPFIQYAFLLQTPPEPQENKLSQNTGPQCIQALLEKGVEDLHQLSRKRPLNSSTFVFSWILWRLQTGAWPLA